ncbi:hypothetical protein [Flavobacterium sp. KACC 22763]|uniref:hypothetical protein n=1 Tax=Flavobacterium sp. KACC 22763 TaxID=3025668 RepID=UPI00236590FF|nr:hypothetical protein [Flavobacterium sp. KACC 22763]WDF65094.1 hypothetical protein PQ463_02820 [Flavobacterium sp. KACC 22763]
MADNDGNKNGRNIYDLIAEHPKYTLLIFILLLCAIIFLAISKVPLKIGNVEVGKEEKKVSDTIVKIKIDTQFIKVPEIEKISVPVNTKQNEKTVTTIAAKNVNNAPNYGTQNIGDVTFNNAVQRKFDNESQLKLMNKIDKYLISNNLPKNYKIIVGVTQGNEEARKYALEIANSLFSKGYNISHVNPTMGNEEKGFEISHEKDKDYVFFDVGVEPKLP